MSFNYLKTFTGLLEKTEVPPRFAIWCGIASLLGALERRVWVEQGVYKVYPNFYIILVAASGQKKSTAIRVAQRAIRDMEGPPKMIAQKLSKEQLISDLAESNGGIIFADELAAFLNAKEFDLGMGPVLTALWDCEEFEYKTLKRGTEKITEGYLSILGGSTVELLRNALPKDAIGGGFTSRTIFVYEDKLAPPVAWVETDDQMMETEAKLTTHLNQLSMIEGPIKLTKEARQVYTEIYEARYYHSEFRRDPNLQGYENRRHNHLITIAIALMMAEKPSRTMTKQHIVGRKPTA